MGLLYGRAGRLTALFGGFRPGQEMKGALEVAEQVAAKVGASRAIWAAT